MGLLYCGRSFTELSLNLTELSREARIKMELYRASGFYFLQGKITVINEYLLHLPLQKNRNLIALNGGERVHVVVYISAEYQFSLQNVYF